MFLFIRRWLFLLLLIPSTVHGQVANFTATPVSGCAPLVVQFTSTSTGPISSYSWNLGNSTTSTLQNPSTTYLTPGTYTVSLTVSGSGGSNTKTVTGYITVQPQPTVNFATNDTAGCPPLSVQFSNTSVGNVPGVLTYAWDFGDGSTSSGATPSHVYTTPGYYTPTLAVTNSAGCSKTLVYPGHIHVFTPPTAIVSMGNNVFCHAPATVNFVNSSAGVGTLSAIWDFGDGGTGSGSTPAHTYTTAGTYPVTLVVTDGNGCKDTAVQQSAVMIKTASFSVPLSGCVNQQLSFSNTSPGPVSSYWTFGDGGNATSDALSYSYTTAGTYIVRLVTNLGGCDDTLTQTIVINPSPVVDFSATPTYPCGKPANVQFTDLSGGGTFWTWDFGDGTTGNGANPMHQYADYGLYNVQLTVINGNGCTNTIVKNNYINLYDHQLSVMASVAGGCVPLTVTFIDSLTSNNPIPGNYPFPVTSHIINYGDGTSSTATPSTHTYTATGTYRVVCTVTTANGCTFKDSGTVIHVGTHPTASFFAYPLSTCVKKEVHFKSTSTNTDSTTTYLWEFGDGQVKEVQDTATTHIYKVPGNYTVKLHVYNNGCEDTISITNYVTVNSPNAVHVDSIWCPPSKNVTMTNLSIGATSQLWDFGDGTTSISANPGIHTYPAFGNYNAQLITYNNVSGCSDTLAIPLKLRAPLTNFVALDTTLCLGDTVWVKGTDSARSFGWHWYFDGVYYGLPAPDTFKKRHYIFTSKGYHNITLITDYQDVCHDTVTRTNYVLTSRPVPGFIATPPIGCRPVTVTFTDTSQYTIGTLAQNRIWSFGDGATGTSTLSAVSHTYYYAGMYDVALIAIDNNGCADSLKKPAFLDVRHPAAGFVTSNSIPCVGDSATFYNTSYGAGTFSYAWTFGDGGTSTQASPHHAYATVGNYTVRLIVTDEVGCKDTAISTNATTVTRPVASFTPSDSIAVCPPLLVHFTNTTTGAVSYTWDLGNTGTSSVTNPVATFTSPGIYTIRLIATNANGCSDTAYRSVKVLGFSGALTYTPIAGCSPMTVNFTSIVANVPNTIWDYGDGTTFPTTSSTSTHTYSTPGVYIPKLIFSDGMGCVNSSTGLDTIKVDKVTAGFVATSTCANAPVLFTDTSHSRYSAMAPGQWDFGGGATATGNTASHAFSTPGTYLVTHIAINALGCRDTITQQVLVYSYPAITALGDTTVCPSDPVHLSATGGVSYVWSPASTLSCAACQSPTASTPVSATYTVTGTDANGCKGTDSVHVAVQLKTTFTASADQAICLGQSLQLYATGADVYHWSPEATLDNPNIATPVATPSINTTYMVVAKEGNCPADTEYVNVYIHPMPGFHLNPEERVAGGESIMLEASGTDIVRYEWEPDTTLSCLNCSNPTATPVRTTTYTVTAYNQYGCKITAKVIVYVLCNGNHVFLPNTFTPNHDGNNDYFYPRGGGLDRIVSFRVYNRWGQVMYERRGISLNDERAGWDGTYKGRELPPDVYVYVLEAMCENGTPFSWKGDITLMR